MRVLVAAEDARVRRALSRLLELDGNSVVGATDDAVLVPELDGELEPDLVVLDLGRRQDAQDLRVVAALARRGRAVIAVGNGAAACAAVLAAGARACLEKDLAFADLLAEAVRAAAGPPVPAPPT